jgi:hypothetical protein
MVRSGLAGLAVIFSFGLLGVAVPAVLQAASWPGAAGVQRSIVRQQDVSVADPIRSITGAWGAAPSGRATVGQTFYGLMLACPVDGGPPATIGIGVLDLPGVRSPIVASFCGNCYDAARGTPPPHDDWIPWANQTDMNRPISFQINFDRENARVGWYIDGTPVRLEQSTLIGPCTRLRVGAVIDEAEPLREMWFDDLQLVHEKAGGQLFEPNDARWPIITTSRGTLGYLGTGTLVTYADASPLEHPIENLPNLHVQGGAGGPVVELNANTAYVGRGQDLVRVDVNGGVVSPLHSFTGTLTALISIGNDIFVGTRDGSVYRVPGRSNAPLASPWRLRAPITSLASGTGSVLAGTQSGMVYLLPFDQSTEPPSALHIDGRIRTLLAIEDWWLVGVETDVDNVPTGHIFQLRQNDDGSLRLQAPVGVQGAPIGLLPVDDESVLVVTASGMVDRIHVGPDGLLREGSVLSLPAPVVAVAGSFPRLHVVGDQGEVWRVVFDELGGATIQANWRLPYAGTGLGLVGSNIIVTSDGGQIGAFATADGKQVLMDESVGVVNSLAAGTDTMDILSGHGMLQRLDVRPDALHRLTSVVLPRRGLALRPWPGGVSVTNGLGGVDLYDGQSLQLVGRIRVVGVSRDVAFSGSTAYVAAGRHGIHVVNVDDPRQPVVSSTFTTNYPALAVASVGQSLLVGRQGGNILAYDASVPLVPIPTGEISGTVNVVRFQIFENQVYALTGSGTVHRLTLDPAHASTVPEAAESLRLSRYGLDLASSQLGLLVAGSADGGLLIVSPDNKVSQLDLPTGVAVTSIGTTNAMGFAGGGPAGLIWWDRRERSSIFLPLLWNP